MSEHRKLKRFHVVAYLSAHEYDTDRFLGRVIDMTSRGMRLCSNNRFVPGSIVKFRMALPGHDHAGEEIRFDASIIWCHDATLPGYFDSGIELQQLSAPDAAAVEQFMEFVKFEERFLSLAEAVPQGY